MLRRFLLVLWLLSLSACAPMILGRTPTPAAVGKTDISILAGYPFGLTEPLVCEVCEYIGPAYWPLPLPLTLHVAYGRTKTLETNVGLMLALPQPLFGVRYGVKERFEKEPVELAFDYGGSLYLTNVGIDAGILAAVPLGEAKLYGGLRAFGSYYYANGVGGAATLTLGGDIPVDNDSSVVLELSFIANVYNGAPAIGSAQPLGFALVPALGFKF